MILVLADCLLEPVQAALTDELMREQIRCIRKLIHPWRAASSGARASVIAWGISG